MRVSGNTVNQQIYNSVNSNTNTKYPLTLKYDTVEFKNKPAISFGHRYFDADLLENVFAKAKDATFIKLINKKGAVIAEIRKPLDFFSNISGIKEKTADFTFKYGSKSKIEITLMRTPPAQESRSLWFLLRKNQHIQKQKPQYSIVSAIKDSKNISNDAAISRLNSWLKKFDRPKKFKMTVEYSKPEHIARPLFPKKLIERKNSLHTI